MTQNRMYDEFAHLWLLISPPEGYEGEASLWRDALREKLGPGRHEVLELGVGGGNNLSHLTADFQATAVDLSEKMMANSMRLNPGVEHHVGDMRTVRLGRKFKAVLIHDAISYLTTADDIRKTFATARAHLEPGGVLVAAPDDYRETFRTELMPHQTRAGDGVELAYVEYTYDPDPDDTTVESVFVYFIKEGGTLRIEQDLHVTGLFSLGTWLKLLDDSGFEAETRPYPVHEDGRDDYLLVGTLK